MLPKRLSEAPSVDPSAHVHQSELGVWTEIGARSKFIESVLGDYSYMVNDSDAIYSHIGKFVNIAAHVRINPGQHPMGRASQHHFQYRSAAYELGEDDADFFAWRADSPVRIGHDVWIGHGAVIMGGVSIGTGAVIGAASVVTRDVAPYSIVAGSPARELRQRFPADIQAALARIAWWDWPHDRLRDCLQDFRQLDVQDFCQKFDPGP